MNKLKAAEHLKKIRDQVYRNMVIQVAIKHFAAHGFENTKMLDIAYDSNISLKTLYSHFESKQVMYEKVLDDVCIRTIKIIEDSGSAALIRGASSVEIFLTIADAWINHMLDHPDDLIVFLTTTDEAIDKKIGPTSSDTWLRTRIIVGIFYNICINENIMINMTIDQFIVYFIAIIKTEYVLKMVKSGTLSKQAIAEHMISSCIRQFFTPTFASLLLDVRGTNLSKNHQEAIEKTM